MTESSSSALFDLTGKVAVVTGGSRGIGLMIARGLLQAGASTVYISSRKADAVAAAAAELSAYGKCVGITADLAEVSECQRLAAEIGEREGRLHILVNNAGATWGQPFEEFTEAGWDRVVDLNMKSPFFLTLAFLPLLQTAATADDPARVINVGSIDGLHVNPLPHYPYSASKAGVHHLTRHLARELGPKQITVNAIAPGPFATWMLSTGVGTGGDVEGTDWDTIGKAIPRGRIGTPEDVAGLAIYLCSRAGSFTVGDTITCDGGIVAS